MVQNIQVNLARGVDAYALSPMQQGMLFHNLEASDRGVDVEQVVCELHEEIDAALFERAWREVVARHAILRTSFHWAGGAEPKQVVHAAADVRLVFRCAEFGSAIEARRGLEEYLAADRRGGFDVEVAPLLRVALLRGGPAHTWWVVTFHHLLLDGRAMIVAFREAMELHDAWKAGRALAWPAARPYRAYIDWLQTLDWSRAEKFWRAQLQGFSSPNVLPLARPAGAAASEGDAHGELALRLPESVTARVRAAARQHDVTVNTFLQGAWAALLARYTGENDVVFGAVRACRHIPVDGAGSIVGLFINTVPVRVRVPAEAKAGEWLRGLRAQWMALRDHEHTPLMKIQQWSDVAPGRALFETLFNYQEPSWDAALRSLGGAWEKRIFDIRSQPNYPLAVDAYGGNAIILKLLYDRRRFADDAVARMLGHYRTLLEAMAGEGDFSLGELPLLDGFERSRVLRAWNATAADYPRQLTVVAQVERHAAHAPEHLAVCDARATLTYGELNRRANEVAHRLMLLGVGAEKTVAVCMERSVEMIVAWLGVLKAGGAFVPLDPAYPKDRLAFQLGDCGAAVLLTQAHVRAALPTAPVSVPVLEVRADGRGFEGEASANPAPRAAAENLAYVIYTSGSTGQPKGVQIEHGSLMNLVTWHRRVYGITPEDRATLLASPAFDAAVWETWPYLTAGASLFIPEDEMRVSPAHLLPWMAEKRITVAFMPTPLAEAAMNEVWPADMALRALLTGGDKLKRPAPENLPCAVINHYGPTESTVVATCSAVARGAHAEAPAIGRPIANTRVYVLDAGLQPLPVGVAGELFIGGDGLARGYLNRPELTAEKFIAAPASLEDAGDRLYRTGDLVRWRTEGELEFLGRLDGQVKVRGYRIELGEIEATLQRHASVREALVLAVRDQLIAYVVAVPGVDARAADLNGFLRAALPAYMVPAAIVFLESWPLTANGKIDRRALPLPELGTPVAASAAELSPTEEIVARTWADVLGRTAVGADDNFFTLGGHSLLAAQVISRLNAAFGAGLSVRHIFDQPTVAGLAREIAQRGERNSAPRPASPRVKRRTPRPEMELAQPN